METVVAPALLASCKVFKTHEARRISLAITVVYPNTGHPAKITLLMPPFKSWPDEVFPTAPK
tara:strand:+ start:213 stop:398 length:186 start_codon:yes stop_codon:yes gene_type:complete